MAVPVVEFSREGYKIRKVFFARNQPNFENCSNGEVSKSVKIGLSKSIF